MENFNKVFAVLLVAFGLMAVGSVSQSQAVNPVVSPKNTAEINYTTTVSTITPVPGTNTISTAQYVPGAVFQIILGTGAPSDYFEMYDSSVTTGINCGMFNATLPTGATMLGPRIFFSSNTVTAQSFVRLDPPMQFFTGLVACLSNAATQASITYEIGRGLSGD